VNASVTGICLLCSISNANRVIDADLTNYATMTVPVGVLATGSLRVTDSSTAFPAGRHVGFAVAQPGQVLSLAALGNVTVRTLLNGTTQEVADSATLLELMALAGNADPNARFLGFEATKPFNAVRIDVGSLLSVSTTMHVYSACVTLQ
jgi:hypothetical protein